LVLTGNLTRTRVFHVKEELCERGHVGQTLNGRVEIARIAEVPETSHLVLKDTRFVSLRQNES